MTLSEDLCRALATMSRLDVEVDIYNCVLAGDAAGVFVECLHQSDRGPVELNRFYIDSQILANALTGDSRVTRFTPHVSLGTNNDAEIAVFSRALASNRGLVDLNLQSCPISDETWSVLCESLQTHPTLTTLGLYATTPIGNVYDALSGEQKVHRTRALAEMMQRNTVLHTIELSANARDQQIYEEMVHPYLETNRYRPLVHAVKKADISLRRPLLGLALQTKSVRNNSNLLWMFLSGNPDVVLQSNEDGAQAEAAASVPVDVAASAPAEVAASAPAEVASTRKRKH
jgi:hypothetical protein